MAELPLLTNANSDPILTWINVAPRLSLDGKSVTIFGGLTFEVAPINSNGVMVPGAPQRLLIPNLVAIATGNPNATPPIPPDTNLAILFSAILGALQTYATAEGIGSGEAAHATLVAKIKKLSIAHSHNVLAKV